MLLDVRGICKTFPVRTGVQTGTLRSAAFFKGAPVGSEAAHRALHNVDLSLAEGECVGLVGSSGSGKTTLANIILGLETADSGSLTFDGETQDVTVPRRKRPRVQQDSLLDMQLVFQFPARSFAPRARVREGIAEGEAYRRGFDKARGRERAADLLEQVGLPAGYLDKRIADLSGGECQRVALARALASNPKLLVCDEATSALDVTVQAEIVALIDRLRRECGMSCLFVTHNLMLARELCARVYVLDNGTVAESGPAAQVLCDPQSVAAQRLLAAALG